MPNKTERLQLRINARDKAWFLSFCRNRGGMSKYVQKHIRSLRRRNPDPNKEDEDEHSE